MSNQPTLLMTFAKNDLAGVQAEADKVWKSVKKNKTIKAKKVMDATIETLAEAIIDCDKDLFMFHFGGHADQKGVLLENNRGGGISPMQGNNAVTATGYIDKIKLSRLLIIPEKHNLQIVFLNGCLSYGHVGILTAKGVKAIIATNLKVNDSEAVRMAAFFYKLFFEKDYTLKIAFEKAVATVGGNNSYITIVNAGEIDENQPLNTTWTLFVHAQHTNALDWGLADFIKTSEPKVVETPATITQTHSGNGDNIAGDKIGRQINIGAGSTFIENPAPTPKPMNFKDTVKDLVKRQQLKEALELIATKSDDNSIILLQSREYRWQNEVNGGTADTRDTDIERNRIVASILSLLDTLF